jgi:hypothetical protein
VGVRRGFISPSAPVREPNEFLRGRGADTTALQSLFSDLDASPLATCVVGVLTQLRLCITYYFRPARGAKWGRSPLYHPPPGFGSLSLGLWPLISDWLPVLAAAPAGAQQPQALSIESRVRSIVPALWRHAGVTSCQAAVMWVCAKAMRCPIRSCVFESPQVLVIYMHRAGECEYVNMERE